MEKKAGNIQTNLLCIEGLGLAAAAAAAGWCGGVFMMVLIWQENSEEDIGKDPRN